MICMREEEILTRNDWSVALFLVFKQFLWQNKILQHTDFCQKLLRFEKFWPKILSRNIKNTICFFFSVGWFFLRSCFMFT